MDQEFTSVMNRAIREIDTGRLKSGRDDMLTAFCNCQDPICKIRAAYNLGAVFWARLGNGEKAREFYQIVVKEAELVGIEKVKQELPSKVANACENLMHLSLTFEEYFAWAAKLRELQPTDDVLRGMVPHIKEAQERGIPWSDVLESLAQQCYNRNDPSRDRGEYARALSTYHLILLNRNTMRLPREAWGRITYEYGTLALRVAADAMNTMVRSRQSMDTAEFTFVVQDAKVFVEEYFSKNPSDDKVQFLLDHMNGFLQDMDKGE